MRNPIQDAFDAVRADAPLIERTRQALLQPGDSPNLSVRLNAARRHQAVRRRQMAAAACVCLLISIVVAGTLVVSTPVAAISIDLDQAVTLRINRFDRIVDVSVYPGAGDDHSAGVPAGPDAGNAGERLAFGLLSGDLRQQPLEAAVARLIAAAAAQGAAIDVSGATIITLATSADAHEQQVELSQKAEAAARQALTDAGREAVLYMEFSGYDRVQEARTLQMTPGRLNLIQKLIELEPDARIEDCVNLDNTTIMRRLASWMPDDESNLGNENGAAGRASDPDQKASGAGQENGSPTNPAQASGGQDQGNDSANSGSNGKGVNGSTGTSTGGSGSAGNAGNEHAGSDSTGNGNAGSGNAGSEGNGGNGAGNANGDKTGNGNSGNGSSSNGNGGNGKSDNGSGGNVKNSSNGQANGRTAKPTIDAAALQRIRQALARSAANASRNAGNRKAA